MNISKGYLTHHGFIVAADRLQAVLGKNITMFFNKLTAIHYPKTGPPHRVVMYSFMQYAGIRWVVLPRALIKHLKGTVVSDVVVELAEVITCKATLCIDLYPNQTLLIDHLINTVFTVDRIENGTATAVLNLRAGMGKTFVAAGLIARLKMRTLFVVLKRPLAVQAVKDLRACLYDENIDYNSDEYNSDKYNSDTTSAHAADRWIVGMFGKRPKRSDPSSIVVNQGVTVMVINSAIMQPPAFFNQYSFVVLDEVHAYCSDTRRKIFKLATSRVVLGMSATTEDRRDGFDVISHKELAFDGIIRAEDIKGFTYEDVGFDCRAHIIRYIGPPEHTRNLTHESTGKVFTHYMHNQFASDPYRTQLAVDELIKLYDWVGGTTDGTVRHFIYVFAEELGILTKLMGAVRKALINHQRGDIARDISAPEIESEDTVHNNNADLKMFTGGLNNEQITDAVTHGRILFSTYGYAGTGVSVTRATAMMFFTPRRANMKQIIARILRRGSDTSIPRIVIDIVDEKTALRCQVGDRKLAYEFYGFATHEYKVRYTTLIAPPSCT